MENEVELISITPKYMDILKLAASQCHQLEANDKTIEHIIKAGHLSVLEHCYATFKISCSVQTLLQLTRHRHLSFTVQSSRCSLLTKRYITGNLEIDELTQDEMWFYQQTFEKDGKPFSLAAYSLPKAAMYSLVVTGNFRAWYEYLGKRLCKRAQEEHRKIAESIHELLRINAPEIFNKNLMKCRTCTEFTCVFNDDKGEHKND